MRKAVVIVFFSLCMAVEVSGAADKTRGSVKENPTLENTKEAKQADPVPASNSISSPFLGKLLVVPMDGSHWVGIKAIAQEMGRRGHQVTVVIPEFSMRMGPGKHYNTITFPVPYDQAVIDHLMSLNKDTLKKSTEPFLERIQSKFSQFQRIFNFIHITVEKLLFNTSLISHLEQQNFDAVLTDPMIPAGSLIARKLGIPTINLLRGIPCGLDLTAAGCPAPSSYVPRFFTGYTDKMNYKERIINTLVSLVEPLFCRLLYWKFDNIAYQFLEEEVGIAEVLSESDIWLQRIDFTLEFPRPLMPNIILVGGINCNVRNPLPQDLESWVSGKHGFVVFTLGSMVSDMPEEITSIFIEAFRQIPQKVIWRYTGNVPGNISDNVKIMKWVPQNDLLAHPGARAFITHAGSHGLFEGLCHAVPMVMVPIGGDQPDNAEKMASRRAGVVLDITSVTTEIIIQGLNEVINDTRYKENMEKLSSLHKDRPIEPLDLSVYWTEFVMRHKGAKHLKAAVHGLNWFQYFCLDVLALMAAVVLVFVILLTKCMKVCFQKLGRKRKQD
ncbi:UDP-glucuronosyltransferase 1A1-like [Melanotaenia boesemani]|uniref:UDP-glucuronosyltransferase 1A1-like n=1 Tax=Melanotaenia boesemani TaxID=1250792 RepID=UPI001C05CE5F|nr:UDP-glucuronosyltransferase 1A1-like [Melanotaenia boesemani]XP_041848038.1 UDP-glucuronosyltransferase 1A1-like [Melanotaenia boesemani]